VTAVHTLMFAGQLNELGNSWITMFKGWATKGLQTGLVCLVVVIMIQKFSLKAGIGALLLMIIALYISFVLLVNPAAGRAVFPTSGPMFKATPPPAA
jgi:hypothetical protein